MKTFLAITLVEAALLTSSPASARDQGVINQVGPDAATQKFYAHPAHFFWSSETPHKNGQHPAVLVKRHEVEEAAPAAKMPTHPALVRRAHVVLAKAPGRN